MDWPNYRQAQTKENTFFSILLSPSAPSTPLVANKCPSSVTVFAVLPTGFSLFLKKAVYEHQTLGPSEVARIMIIYWSHVDEK